MQPTCPACGTIYVHLVDGLVICMMCESTDPKNVGWEPQVLARLQFVKWGRAQGIYTS